MISTNSELFNPQSLDPHSLVEVFLREEPDEEEEDDEEEDEDEGSDEDEDEDGDDGYSE